MPPMAGSGDHEGEGLPLAGKVVVVTRAKEQAAGLTEPLAALGAEVLSMPVIVIADPEDWGPADAAIDALDTFDWLVLTSANGVERFFARLAEHGRAAGELTGARVAVVGATTAEALRALAVEQGMVPDRFRAEGLVERFRSLGAQSGGRVLIARAAEARELLPDELRALGFQVTVVPVYRLAGVRPQADVIARLAAGDVDVVTFASGGTARRFFDALREEGVEPLEVLRGLCVASIGPVTSDALRDLGREPDVEAAEATAQSLVEALIESGE